MKTKIKFQRIVLPLLLMGSPLAAQAATCDPPCIISGSDPKLFWVDSDFAPSRQFWVAETVNNNRRFQIGDTLNNKPFIIEFDAASNLLFLDAAERIGINTSTPEVTVDAVGTSRGVIRLRDGTGGTAKTIMMRVDSAATDIHSQNADLYLRSENTPGDPDIIRDIIMNPSSTDGNVGIGTIDPDERFKVDLKGKMRAFFSGNQRGGDGLVPLIALESKNNAAGKSSDTGFSLKNVKDNFQWNYRTLEAGGAQGFAATKNGSGGAEMIVQNPTNDFHNVSILMGNGAQLTSFGVWQNASSRKYKENIKPIALDEAMDALNQLNPVKYHFKRDTDKEMNLGFIAEDVPDLVATKGRKNMDTMEVVATLTKVVQYQQKVIQDQQKVAEEQQKIIQEQQKFAEEQQKAAEKQKKLTMELSDKLAELDKMVRSNAMVAMQ